MKPSNKSDLPYATCKGRCRPTHSPRSFAYASPSQLSRLGFHKQPTTTDSDGAQQRAARPEGGGATAAVWSPGGGGVWGELQHTPWRDAMVAGNHWQEPQPATGGGSNQTVVARSEPVERRERERSGGRDCGGRVRRPPTVGRRRRRRDGPASCTVSSNQPAYRCRRQVVTGLLPATAAADRQRPPEGERDREVWQRPQSGAGTVRSTYGRSKRPVLNPQQKVTRKPTPNSPAHSKSDSQTRY